MERSRKKQKLIAEECELIINIDNNGACNFDIVSKIESICNGVQNNVCNGVQNNASPSIPGDVHHDMKSTIESVCDSDQAVDSTDEGKDKMGTSECNDCKAERKECVDYHIPESGSSRLFRGVAAARNKTLQYNSSTIQQDLQKSLQSDGARTQPDGGYCNVNLKMTATDTKDVGEYMASIPPTSQYLALDCEFVGVLCDKSALGMFLDLLW